MALKGIIFDFDGLIIDTELPGCNAWAELFNQHGFSFTIEDWKKAIGTGPSAYDPAKHLSQLTNGLLDAHVIKEQTLIRTRQLIEEQPLLPGVFDFIITCDSLGIPMAVASSSNRAWVEGYLEKLGIRNYFKVVCTSNDVANVKPDPELFLLAAKKLGISPSEAIIFEDSPSGIKAAYAAGIPCIAIPNDITKSMDLSLATKIVDSFLDLNPQSLISQNN
ncbi:MAG: haloacid dehalogenase [Chloroflexi bacterium HGW-Chloroflexi-4]|jgi:putative hydrolase of the HAD superfamily|nr:MAG: haloacid dehalogenase [Chloroflexi bacterium HGW-Chloroflexi-4]